MVITFFHSSRQQLAIHFTRDGWKLVVTKKKPWGPLESGALLDAFHTDKQPTQPEVEVTPAPLVQSCQAIAASLPGRLMVICVGCEFSPHSVGLAVTGFKRR